MDIQEIPIEKPIFIEPEYHQKGWGTEIWIHNSELYCGKILNINKDCIMSYHYHKEKTETFYLQTGKIVVILGDMGDEFFRVPTRMERMTCGDVLEIPKMTPHAIIALEDSAILEVSTEHKEEDSYRIIKGD